MSIKEEAKEVKSDETIRIVDQYVLGETLGKGGYS